MTLGPTSISAVSYSCIQGETRTHKSGQDAEVEQEPALAYSAGDKQLAYVVLVGTLSLIHSSSFVVEAPQVGPVLLPTTD